MVRLSHSRRSSLRLALLAGGVLGLSTAAPTANAWVISASDPFVTIRVTSGAMVGIVNIPLAAAGPFDLDLDLEDDVFFWAEAALPIYEGTNAVSGNVVASLFDIQLLGIRNNVDADGSGPGTVFEVRHGIDLSFVAKAGSAYTTFEILGPTLMFNPIANARASASSGFVGLDADVDGDVTLSPLLAGPFAYETAYNGVAGAGGTTFKGYNDTVLTNSPPTAGFNQAFNMDPLSDNDADPTNGIWNDLNTTVSSASIRLGFGVTANDEIPFSSTYSIAPTPSAVALLGLSGLVLARRRRS